MHVYNILSIWELYVAADQGDSSVSVLIFYSTKYITTPFVSVAIRGYPSVNSLKLYECFDSTEIVLVRGRHPIISTLGLFTRRPLDTNTNKYKQ